MGLEDDVRSLIAAEAEKARLVRERANDLEVARLAWLNVVDEFVRGCVTRSIPTRRVSIVQEHNSGAGRFLRELVGGDSAAFSHAGSTQAWGPLLSHSGEYSSSFIAITPEMQVLNVDREDRGLVHIRPDPHAVTPAESPYWYETAKRSMVKFLAAWPTD